MSTNNNATNTNSNTIDLKSKTPCSLDANFVTTLLEQLYPGNAGPKANFPKSKPTTISAPNIIKSLLKHAPDSTSVAQAFWKWIKEKADKNVTDFVDTKTLAQPINSVQPTISSQHAISVDPKGKTWDEAFKAMKKKEDTIKVPLVEFADDAITHILFPVRNRANQPKPKPNNSLSGNTQTSNNPTGSNQKAPRNSEAFRRELGERDLYMCVITKVAEVDNPTMAFRGPLEGAHILPHSLADTDKAGFRDALALFAGPTAQITGLTNGLASKINDASNGMLIEPNCHSSFDKLQWSIKATIEPNQNTYTYKVRYPDGRPPFAGLATPHLTQDKVLTFCTGKNTILPPDPHYCNLHHAVFQVVNATGLADVFDTFLNEDDTDKPPTASGTFVKSLSEKRSFMGGEDQETDTSDIEAEGTKSKRLIDNFSNPLKV